MAILLSGWILSVDEVASVKGLCVACVAGLFFIINIWAKIIFGGKLRNPNFYHIF